MPRAIWKGHLKIAELTCGVALYTAVSQADRMAFHTLNRATGHRVRRQFVDQDTGELVEAAGQVKGYEVGPNEYVVLEPAEIAQAVPESDKTLSVDRFISLREIDDLYFDRPYYLAPSDGNDSEAFSLVRVGMAKFGVAAVARAVLFRRVRTVLILPRADGLVAVTLRFDYEIRPPDELLSDIPAIKIELEMLDLAKHIIDTKRGTFDPASFHDRYEAALADLVKAKRDGRPLPVPQKPRATEAVDLLAALRQSAADLNVSPNGKSNPKNKRDRAGATATKQTKKAAEAGTPRASASGHRRKAS